MIIGILLILLLLCWGSFLNVVAYRLIKGESLFGRSRCVHCKHPIAWYDLIPVVSYLNLRGRCRTCHRAISPLYPFIELFTMISMFLLYYWIDFEYFIAYFILFSALIITIRTDLEAMLISRWVTLALVPVGFILSISDYIPILPLNSLMGAAFGYISLWLIGTVFYYITGKRGIGEGDFELLGLIGAFTGMLGVWASILLGSLLGSSIGLIYLKSQGKLERHAQLPFGPFLAFGAIIYVLFQDQITLLLTGAF